MTKSYTLMDAEKQHADHPETFWIPENDERHALVVGDTVKLVFHPLDSIVGERMWVQVTKVLGEGKYKGKVDSHPVVIKKLKAGSLVTFEAKHVINIWEPET